MCALTLNGKKGGCAILLLLVPKSTSYHWRFINMYAISIIGVAGLPGMKGDRGRDGVNGLPGPKGDSGLPGRDGIKGNTLFLYYFFYSTEQKLHF